MAELLSSLIESGFEDVQIVERFGCFVGTSKQGTAAHFGVIGVNLLARKPGQ